MTWIENTAELEDRGESNLSEKEIFTVPARRCKRCGGLLTSAQGIRDGYGPCCLRKMRQEEADRKMLENQCSLFDMEPIERVDDSESAQKP